MVASTITDHARVQDFGEDSRVSAGIEFIAQW